MEVEIDWRTQKILQARTIVGFGTEELIKSRTESLIVKEEVRVARPNSNGTYTS